MTIEERAREIAHEADGCPRMTHDRQYVSREMALDAGSPEMEGSLYSEEEWEQTQPPLRGEDLVGRIVALCEDVAKEAKRESEAEVGRWKQQHEIVCAENQRFREWLRARNAERDALREKLEAAETEAGTLRAEMDELYSALKRAARERG
jgi:hypothetical protein